MDYMMSIWLKNKLLHTLSPNLESHPSKRSTKNLKSLRVAIEAGRNLSNYQGKHDTSRQKEK